jgi:hypothetical protein
MGGRVLIYHMFNILTRKVGMAKGFKGCTGLKWATFTFNNFLIALLKAVTSPPLAPWAGVKICMPSTAGGSKIVCCAFFFTPPGPRNIQVLSWLALHIIETQNFKKRAFPADPQYYDSAT